jgi:hypothetical protein
VNNGLRLLLATAGVAFLFLRKDSGETEGPEDSDMFSTRERIVNWAESQEDESDPTPYWYSAIGRPVQDPDTDWCGAFVLTALHRQGLALNRSWQFGKGLEATLPLLQRTTDPKPGDIAYFTHNQHVAVVAEVTPTAVRLVNGNSTGGRVAINERPRKDVTAFYSIERYLSEKESES